MIYSEQMYTACLNYSDNHCWQYYNGLMLLQQSLNVASVHHFYL